MRMECTKPCAHTQPINYNFIPQKDTMIPYMDQPRCPLNSQDLVKFFPFATTPATPHHFYSESDNRPIFSTKWYVIVFLHFLCFFLHFPQSGTHSFLVHNIHSASLPPPPFLSLNHTTNLSYHLAIIRSLSHSTN